MVGLKISEFDWVKSQFTLFQKILFGWKKVYYFLGLFLGMDRTQKYGVEPYSMELFIENPTESDDNFEFNLKLSFSTQCQTKRVKCQTNLTLNVTIQVVMVLGCYFLGSRSSPDRFCVVTVLTIIYVIHKLINNLILLRTEKIPNDLGRLRVLK